MLDLFLPADRQGVCAQAAADRLTRARARLPAVERDLVAWVQLLAADDERAKRTVLATARAFVNAVGAPRQPTALGREWTEHLAKVNQDAGAAKGLLSEVLERMVDQIIPDLSDPARAWIVTHSVATQSFIVASSQRMGLERVISRVARQTADKVTATATALDLLGCPDRALVSGQIETALAEWCKDARSLSTPVASVAATASFVEHLVQRIEAPTSWWHFLWSLLGHSIGQRIGRWDHVLSGPIARMAQATPYYGVLRSWGAADLTTSRILRQLVSVVCVLSRDKVPDQLEWLPMLDRAAVARTLGHIDLETLRHSTREALRHDHERHHIDPLTDTLVRVERWVAGSKRSTQVLTELGPRMRDAALIFAEGQQGSDAADLQESLLRSLIEGAVLAETASTDERCQRAMMRQHLVFELGVGRLAIWRRYREIMPAIRRAVNESQIADDDPFLPLVALIDSGVNAARDCPVQWGDEHAARHARDRPGCDQASLRWALRAMAVGVRLGGAFEAAERAFDAWEPRLGHDAAFDCASIHATWNGLTHQVHETQPPRAIRAALTRVVEFMPSVLGGLVLPHRAWLLSTRASDEVFERLPEYASQVGEAGHTSCVRDNAFTLLALGRVLRRREADPVLAMWSWWSASVDAYLSTRRDDLFRANLVALRSGLRALLEGAEGQLASSVLTKMYSEHLGIEEKLVRDDRRRVTPRPYQAHGPHWAGVLGRDAASAQVRHEGAAQMDAWATAAELQRETRQLLCNWAKALDRTADPEESLDRNLSAIVECARQLGTEALISDLDRLEAQGVVGVGASAFPFWSGALQTLRRRIQDVGLGQRLEHSVTQVATHVADALAEFAPSDNPEQRIDKCVRDQTILLSFMARSLQTRTASLTALEVGRFLVMGVAPFVRYDAATWRMVWTGMRGAMWSECTSNERDALQRWVEQLAAMADGLPHLAQVGRDVFHADGVVLAEEPEIDRQWRELIAGLLAAAITDADAPTPPSALVQQLLLVDPILGDETADTWPDRGQSLSTFLSELVPEPIARRVSAVSDEVLVGLMCIERLRALPARSVGTWAAVMSGHRRARSLWLAELAARASTGAGLRTPEDLAVSQATGWALPDGSRLRNDVRQVAAVLDLRGPIPLSAQKRSMWSWFKSTTPTADPSETDHQAALSWLRRHASAGAIDGPGGDDALLVYVRSLGDGVDGSRLLGGLVDMVPDELSRGVAEAAQSVPATSLAARLMADPEGLAEAWVAPGGPMGSRRPACVRDLSILLVQVAGALLGRSAHSPRAFYEHQVLPFLRDETRSVVSALLSAGPARVGPMLGPGEAEVLERALAPVVALVAPELIEAGGRT